MIDPLEVALNVAGGKTFYVNHEDVNLTIAALEHCKYVSRSCGVNAHGDQYSKFKVVQPVTIFMEDTVASFGEVYHRD